MFQTIPVARNVAGSPLQPSSRIGTYELVGAIGGAACQAVDVSSGALKICQVSYNRIIGAMSWTLAYCVDNKC